MNSLQKTKINFFGIITSIWMLQFVVNSQTYLRRQTYDSSVDIADNLQLETLNENAITDESHITSTTGKKMPCKPESPEDTGIRYLSKAETYPSVTGGGTKTCIGNRIVTESKTYPCKNMHLESFINLQDLGEMKEANDVWGATIDGVDYAVIGLMSGTTFVRLTDPNNPVVVGKLPTQTMDSIWRDMKTYKNFAFIVSEASRHGLQIFDMTLLNKATYFHTYTATSHMDFFGNAHNLFINEDSGIAYIVGSNQCNGGMLFVDVNEPQNPVYLGCYANRGYVHDLQCVIYDGPDTNYVGKEVCFCYSEDKVDIVDVTDKNSPSLISTFTYSGQGYVHQGWLTEDRNHILIDDEIDELYGNGGTKTIICDVSSLDNPTLVGSHISNLNAIDHNLYIVGDFVYQANYRAGLRVLGLNQVASGKLQEVGYFDVYPDSDNNQFNGSWSTYPFFKSGVVLVSGIEQGLFILRSGVSTVDLDEVDEDDINGSDSPCNKQELTVRQGLPNLLSNVLFSMTHKTNL